MQAYLAREKSMSSEDVNTGRRRFLVAATSAVGVAGAVGFVVLEVVAAGLAVGVAVTVPGARCACAPV